MNVVNTYCPGVPAFGPVGHASLMIVLTQDAEGKFAAYMGIVSLDHSKVGDEQYAQERTRRAEQVAHSGSKLNYRMAIGFFPSLTQGEYRA